MVSEYNANINLLRVVNIVKHFPIKKWTFSKTSNCVRAVDGVTFNIDKGETFGLVGESGCGKTTIGNIILSLTKATSGEIYYEGINIDELHFKELQKLRKKIQVIFQDPYASLNPRMTVGSILSEPIRFHKIVSSSNIDKKVVELLELVGLSSQHLKRYPHEFSGGQRQRIGIARALALNPELIICDEPVSALDVSIQSQILNLLVDMQKELGIAYLFISHDLPVVKHVADRIGVMYLGQIVEVADSEIIYENPKHPYTNALISSIPISHPDLKRERIILEGDVPSPMNTPTGCHFHSRCQNVKPICKENKPDLKDLGSNHYVSCHFI